MGVDGNTVAPGGEATLMGEARVPGVTTGFAAEPGADVTGDAFGLVKICSFPSGICTSCCPGRRPRTWILPSLERTIWTFCCGWLAAEGVR